MPRTIGIAVHDVHWRQHEHLQVQPNLDRSVVTLTIACTRPAPALCQSACNDDKERPRPGTCKTQRHRMGTRCQSREPPRWLRASQSAQGDRSAVVRADVHGRAPVESPWTKTHVCEYCSAAPRYTVSKTTTNSMPLSLLGGIPNDPWG